MNTSWQFLSRKSAVLQGYREKFHFFEALRDFLFLVSGWVYTTCTLVQTARDSQMAMATNGCKAEFDRAKGALRKASNLLSTGSMKTEISSLGTVRLHSHGQWGADSLLHSQVAKCCLQIQQNFVTNWLFNWGHTSIDIPALDTHRLGPGSIRGSSRM